MSSAEKTLAFMRVAFGGWLLWLALPNLDAGFVDSLGAQLQGFAAANPYEPYRWIMHQFMIPCTDILGQVLSVGQFLVASALIIGFLTRFTTAVGLFYTVNFALATTHLGGLYPIASILLALTFITLWISDAGRYWGIDNWLFTHDDEPIKKSSGKKKAKNKPQFKNRDQQRAVEALARQMKAGKKNGSRSKKTVPDWGEEDDDD